MFIDWILIYMRYYISRRVKEEVILEQTFEIDASSEDEALKLLKSNPWDYLKSEDIDDDLGTLEVLKDYTVDDVEEEN